MKRKGEDKDMKLEVGKEGRKDQLHDGDGSKDTTEVTQDQRCDCRISVGVMWEMKDEQRYHTKSSRRSKEN